MVTMPMYFGYLVVLAVVPDAFEVIAGASCLGAC